VLKQSETANRLQITQGRTPIGHTGLLLRAAAEKLARAAARLQHLEPRQLAKHGSTNLTLALAFRLRLDRLFRI
jgi:hypothetical protein